MNRKPNPESIDRDTPEWSKADFKQAKRLKEMPAEFQQVVRPKVREAVDVAGMLRRPGTGVVPIENMRVELGRETGNDKGGDT